jgi:hypothetical protein
MSISAKFPSRPAGSVEFDLLCLVARPRPDLARAEEVLRAGVDFSELIRLAAVHGVRPQLMASFHRLPHEAVPAATRESLEFYHRFHCARALSLAEELCRVAAAFAARGIRFAAFKGPALAAALYGDVSCRDYTDPDILYLRQCAFVHPGIDAAIDLHWDFTGAYMPFPLTPAEVWRDLAQVSIGDREISTVSGVNLALLLAGHGTKEAWRCLGWVCDFATLLDRHPELDWQEIHRRARAQGCGDAVLLACVMARELLDMPEPGALRGPIDESARVGALAALLTRQLREGRLESAKEQNFSDFHLCESRFDKLKAVTRLAVTRTTSDYEAMKLPPALWPVYYATRPFRLAAKAVAAMR